MCCGTDPDANFAQAQKWIRKAAADGAKFIATPENTNLLQMDRCLLLRQICTQDEDPILRQFCGLAKALNITLLLGSLAIRVSKNKAANRSFVISPDGKISAQYDKIHLFDVQISSKQVWRESDHIQPGHTAIVTDIGAAKLGLSICYDLRFAKLYRQLAEAGAQILAVPAAFTRTTGKAHWQTLLQARAIETASFVIAPAQGGTHVDGRKTWGHSMVIDPWGKVIAELQHDHPGVLLADIDLALVAKTRARIPVLEQTQEFDGP
ncbi:FIG003879: Uncharacterized subgroup of the nitrilase superfamily [hydrothermal vent metagenome]|uniref:FIG003879: Uncharacterized subgroup of the nitrilase superfamily n=1 Tax=hydrothermal vent metagenome TaxID=652676 RepID=A0A3B0SIQ4_9ZZZZ